MEEIIKRFIGFFESDKISISRKIGIPSLVIFSVLLLDNVLGTSYYWINTIETNYIVKIEEAKKICSADSVLVAHFNEKIENAINRQNIFEWFISLFENTNIEEDLINENKTYNDKFNLDTIFPEAKRNKLFHTITSSFLWIYILAYIIFLAIFTNVLRQKNKRITLSFIIFLVIIVCILIGISQWIFGLIPVICHRAYINYILQISINLIPIIASIKDIIKRKRNNKKHISA